MGAGEQILHAIEGLLAAAVRIEGKLDLLVNHLGANRGSTGAGQSEQGGRVADLRETTGDKGDPKIRMVPKAWTGESFKGVRASQCDPEFLNVYADQLDWFADNPKEGEDPKKAKWDRLDAARCRRWAVEIREGRVRRSGSPEPTPTPRSNGAPPAEENPWGSDAPGDDGSW